MDDVVRLARRIERDGDRAGGMFRIDGDELAVQAEAVQLGEDFVARGVGGRN